MNPFVQAKRTEIRTALERNGRHGVHAGERLTSLGMHYIDIDGTPVLVAVEINVPRILAVLGKRLVKSKSATARIANGSVRLTIATAEGREICGAVQS